jgi:hypothetical protein
MLIHSDLMCGYIYDPKTERSIIFEGVGPIGSTMSPFL